MDLEIAKTHMESEGFVHIYQVFSHDEIAEIRKLTENVTNNDAPTQPFKGGFRSWRAVSTSSLGIAQLVCDPRLVAIVMSILGSCIRLLDAQLIHRHPIYEKRSTRIPENPGWHRDIYDMTHDLGSAAPRCSVKCAVWLSDAIELEHGATRFLPGSHLLPALPKIPKGEIDPEGWVTPTVHAGDVTVFENRIAHAGGLNTSQHMLQVLMLSYGYRWLSSPTGRSHHQSILREFEQVHQQLLEPNPYDLQGSYVPSEAIAMLKELLEKLRVKS
jgi:ectoine hydroxylase-related dioxygenase (phytanoyl-CoA dioxygenase family)